MVIISAFAPRRVVGIHSTEPAAVANAFGRMADLDESDRLSWPGWATWALIAVALTCIATVAATLYDIL